MKIFFRIAAELIARVRSDLRRPHDFAHERMGFVEARAASLSGGNLTLIAYDYLPVEDNHYLNRPEVGAFMSSDGLRVAMQRAYHKKCSMLHVHLHEHNGRPGFSRYDLSENQKFVPDFFNVAPRLPHGALVLSLDNAAGLCWVAKGVAPLFIDEIVEIGAPLRIFPKV